MEAERPKPLRTLPIQELPNGLILLKARVGSVVGQWVLIDFGSSLGFVVDRAFANRARLPGAPSRSNVKIEGLPSESVVLTDWRVVAVKDDRVTLSEGTAPAVDLSGLEDFLGVPVAGIIGAPIASRFVVRVDHDQKTVAFYDPAKYQPEAGAIVLDLDPIVKTKLFSFHATLYFADCEEEDVNLYVDSGSDRSLVLGPKLSAKHPDSLVRNSVTRGVGVGSAGFDAYKANVRGLRLGSVFVPVKDAISIPAAGTIQIQQQSDGSIGAPMLQLFNFAVDISRSKLYLFPRTSTQGVLQQVSNSCPVPAK